ncbi:hypothetical protein Cgig2_024182 [Carnegiea gigantea]|uniref:Uncharacterized protein n=1 Tax=Carnegiea gigantea TaxID=171969 RepID=A0A9Q1K9X0_9CARY|nr:hypothetical protein Cgig2_024182 [Carnegiea gigantea]
MEAIKKESVASYEWLLGEPVENWARYTFPVHLKCPDNTTNFVESFNDKIELHRHKLVFTLLEEIRRKFMKTIANRFKAERECPKLGPRPVQLKRGRPPCDRRRDKIEKRKVYNRTNTLRCSKCKQFGHNSKSHRENNVLQIRREKDKPRKPKVGEKRRVGRPSKVDKNTLKKAKTTEGTSSQPTTVTPSSSKLHRTLSSSSQLVTAQPSSRAPPSSTRQTRSHTILANATRQTRSQTKQA